MNYYISHFRNSALANNLTATSYLSHLMNLLFFHYVGFKKRNLIWVILESISLQVLLFHLNFLCLYLQQYFFRWFNSMQLRVRQSTFFFRYISPLGQGSRTHGMIAQWAVGERNFYLYLCVINSTVLFIDVRTVRFDWMILSRQLPYQGHTIVCFSYLSTQAPKILNLSHEGIINSVVPPSTNGTLTSEKTFPSKSWDSFTSFIFSGLPPKSNNKT